MATKQEVQSALEIVRPALQNDGGDVELVDVNGDKVYLRLQGHCRGCAYSQMTLKRGIEQFLKKELKTDSIEVIGVD